MLRLNSTLISLEKKDLDWHIDRHHKRQAARSNAPPINVNNSLSKAQGNQQDLKSTNHTRYFPRLSLSAERACLCSESDTALISSDPVPQDSKAFWDKVLAEAGTPTRTQTTSSGNGRMFEPSDDWLETHRSSRASLEESFTDVQDQPDYDELLSGDLVSQQDDSGEENSCQPRHQSSDSFYSAPGVGDDAVDSNPVRTLEEPVLTSPRLSRFTSFFNRKAKTDDLDERSRHDAGCLELDGPSDFYQYHQKSPSSSSYSGLEAEINDGLYGNRRDRRTISSSLEAYVHREDEPETGNASAQAVVPPARALSPPTALPQSVEALRRRSGALPRSPLYISQAAASSSPDKRQEGPSKPFSLDNEGASGLLTQPARRRKTYRPRSLSNSPGDTKNSAADMPYMDGPAVRQATSPNISSLQDVRSNPYLVFMPAESATSEAGIGGTSSRHASNNYLRSSPPNYYAHSNGSIQASPLSAHIDHPTSSPTTQTLFGHYRSCSSGTSPEFSNSHTPSPSRNLSPYAQTFISQTGQRQTSPQLPLPPPFSAAHRIVSFNLSLPSSTTSSPPVITRTQESQISPLLTHNPPSSSSNLPVPSISPHTPRRTPRTHFQIYNDAIPPTHQPQTPADVHPGRPRATQNPFNTDPARVAGLPSRNARPFATPTRRRPVREREVGLDAQDVENVDAVTSEERYSRRWFNAGRRIGGEERERLEGGLGG